MLVVVPSATAAVPLTPADGTTLNGFPKPTFTWSQDPSETESAVAIGRDPIPDPAQPGHLLYDTVETSLGTPCCAWAPSLPLLAGTYYWFASAPGAEGTGGDSPARTLTVLPLARVDFVHTQVNANHQLMINFHVTTNYANSDTRVRIYRGRRRLLDRFVGWAVTRDHPDLPPVHGVGICLFCGRFPRGTVLRYEVSVRAGSAYAVKSSTYRVP